MKLEISIKDLGVVFVIEGNIEQLEEFARAISVHDGEEHSFVVLSDIFKVYYDKSKWDVIET